MFDKIAKLIAEQLQLEVEEITEQSRIVEDLGADSLDVVELIMMLEEDFGMSVADEDSLTLKTVSDIVNYVEKNASEETE